MDKQMTFGAIPSPYDPRDYSVQMINPALIASSSDLPDVYLYNQGNVGNCVMQAIRAVCHNYYYFGLAKILGESLAMELMRRLYGVSVAPTQDNTELGATFGYGWWRSSNMGPGMRPNEACTGLARDGIPPARVDNEYHEMPDARRYAEANLTRMLAAAAPFKGLTWARLYTVDEVRAALSQGIYCIVCLPSAGISAGRWNVDGPASGFHELMIKGHRDDTRMFRARNSWGTGGGIGGAGDGYVNIAYNDIFACNDVIAIFPPADDIFKTDKKEGMIVDVRRTLRLKDPYMRGDDVKEFQAKVKAHGFDPGGIDGVFGKNSDAAAKGFQRAKGLVVDGIVGAKTWAALDKPGTQYDVDAIEGLMRLMVGDPYIIGAQGHELTKEYLDKRKAAAPAYFTNGRYEWLVEQIKLAQRLNRKLYCEDCSGLLMACNDVLGFWPDKDLTAEGIRKRCKKITRAEVRPGDIAFRVVDGEANHMAWVGNAGLYEAVGTVYGVVLRTDIDERKTLNQMTGKVDNRPDWTEWGRP